MRVWVRVWVKAKDEGLRVLILASPRFGLVFLVSS
jgi:hypothetical protein